MKRKTPDIEIRIVFGSRSWLGFLWDLIVGTVQLIIGVIVLWVLAILAFCALCGWATSHP